MDMNLKMKLILSSLGVFTVVFGSLWVREHGKSAFLASLNQTLTVDNVKLHAERNGLRAANEDLWRQLEDMRNLTANLPEPYMEPLPQPVTLLPPAAIEEEGRLAVMERAEARERTPEEEAAREQRRQEWEARRTEMEQRRADFRNQIVSESQFRREFFSQISTDDLAPEYKASHERLLGMMEQTEGVVAALSDPELSGEEQRELRRDLGRMAVEMQGLLRTQREILLNDYAQALGFHGQEARQFIDYLETIQQMTSMGGMMRGAGGPPRGQGRPERTPEN